MLTNDSSWMLRDGAQERALSDENYQRHTECVTILNYSNSQRKGRVSCKPTPFWVTARPTVIPLESPLLAAHQGRQRTRDEMHSPLSYRQRRATIPC